MVGKEGGGHCSVLPLPACGFLFSSWEENPGVFCEHRLITRWLQPQEERGWVGGKQLAPSLCLIFLTFYVQSPTSQPRSPFPRFLMPLKSAGSTAGGWAPLLSWVGAWSPGPRSGEPLSLLRPGQTSQLRAAFLIFEVGRTFLAGVSSLKAIVCGGKDVMFWAEVTGCGR